MRRRLPLDAGLLLVLVAAAIWRLAWLGAPSLTPGEAQAWSADSGQLFGTPDAAVTMLARASAILGGEAAVGMRWLNAVLGVAAVALVYALGKRLYGRGAALLAAGLMALGAPYLLSSRFISTDGLFLFSLLLYANLVAPMLEGAPQRTWRFVARGLTMALLLNCTYDAYLYVLAMACVVLWRRRRDLRPLLADPRSWWVVALTVAGLFPALIMNVSRGWVGYASWIEGIRDGVLSAVGLRTSLASAAGGATLPILLVAVLGIGRLTDSRARPLLWPALLLVALALVNPAHSPGTLRAGLALMLIPGASVVDGLSTRWLSIPREEARPAILVLLRWAVLVALAVCLVFVGGALGRAALARTRGEAFGWSNAFERGAWGPLSYVAVAVVFGLLVLVMRALQSPASSRADLRGIARALGLLIPAALIAVNGAFGIDAVSGALGDAILPGRPAEILRNLGADGRRAVYAESTQPDAECHSLYVGHIALNKRLHTRV